MEFHTIRTRTVIGVLIGRRWRDLVRLLRDGWRESPPIGQTDLACLAAGIGGPPT